MDKENRIKEVIEKIKPLLQNDGGNIEFVKYEDGIVYVTIEGVCSHCYMLNQTLEAIEMSIKSVVPEIEKVEII